MKQWCNCNKHCMVKNPRKPVVHGKTTTYESRHGCRCIDCVHAYRIANIERELRGIDKKYLWLFEEDTQKVLS